MVKEACHIIEWLAKKFPKEFALENNKQSSNNLGGGNGIYYFRDDALPRMIICGTKQLQQMGHKTIKDILEGDIVIDNLIHYLLPLMYSKSTLMRLHNAEYFEIILSKANERTNDFKMNIRNNQLVE